MQLPSAATNPHQQAGQWKPSASRINYSCYVTDAKHRGFAFVTYSSSADAQDAIDNMDLNELRGRVIKVNLARPMKGPVQLGGNRAGTLSRMTADCPPVDISAQYGSQKSGSSTT